MTIEATADTWGRAPNRLRDLRGRERTYAIALLVLVLVPFVVAIVRAFQDGWIPSGDEANIATRALDVFSRHPPLTGLPSTSALYGDKIATNHPGPIEFYLLAVPIRLLGATTGPLLTAAAINCGFVLVALWAVFRRLGTTAMLGAGVLVAGVMWSAGTAVLTDTLSSNMTMYSLLCTAVLAWALVDGDLHLLPLAAFVASYAAQQHLAAGIIVGALFVTVVVAVVAQTVPRTRRSDGGLVRALRRAAIGAAVVVVVCWLPVVIDEVKNRPGNLTEIVKFARDNTRPTMGFNSAVDQTVRAVSPPTILTRTDTPGVFFLHSLGVAQAVLGTLVILLLVAVAVFARRRSVTVARLAVVAAVLLVAGFVNGNNIPLSVESWRVNLYRWTWAAVTITWLALGLAAVLLVARYVRAPEIERRISRFAPVALLVVTAIIAGATIFVSGKDDHNRELPAFSLEQRASAVVLSRVDHRRPVVIVTDGYAASLSVAPAIIFRLIRAGIKVEVPSSQTQVYGKSRAYWPYTDPAAIVVTSAPTKLRAEPGELLLQQSFSPERHALLDALAAQAKGQRAVLAPGAAAAIARQYGTAIADAVQTRALDVLPTNPRAVLDEPFVLQLFLDGRIASPRLDAGQLRRFAALSSEPHEIGGDEVVAVHYLGPDAVAGAHLAGL